MSPPHRQCGGILQRRVQLVIDNRKHRVVFPVTVAFSVAVQCRKVGFINMPCATLSSHSRLDFLLLSLIACAFASCSGSTSDNGAPNGSTSTSGGTQGVGGRASYSSTSGTHLSSTAGGSDSSSGGTATLITKASGGASTTTARGSSLGGNTTLVTKASGGASTAQAGGTTAATARSCVPASQDGPPDHLSSGYESQPCSDCHHDALRGGLVYNPAGDTVAGATIEITPQDGSVLQAVTGSNGMFVVREPISAPYVACVSKCPDMRCSKSSDHPSTDDCGTCHGVTTNKIQLP
ncbi:MAG TPA: hypothetical protein VKP30_33820 [Polyangiaceae bacterium]|nr:hypothetical protein [Polyangiaceae bacterium]